MIMNMINTKIFPRFNPLKFDFIYIVIFTHYKPQITRLVVDEDYIITCISGWKLKKLTMYR